MSKDVLLEIGTEEIPAHYMPSVLSQVQQLAADKLNKANIAYEDIRAVGTPRRVALLVKGVAEKQADISSKNKGPSVKIAYDSDGNLIRSFDYDCMMNGYRVMKGDFVGYWFQETDA